MPQDYKPIVTDSNYVPIGIELKRRGALVDLSSWAVTISVRDPSAEQQMIVTDGAAQVVGLGRADFYFSAEQVSAITRNSTWLCEWCFTDSATGRKLRLAPIRLPVLVRLQQASV